MRTKNLLLFLLSLLITIQTVAQVQYSYMTDRIFIEATDMVGYNFIPDFMEIPNESESELKPGDFSFGVTTNNLYVDGKGVKGVYSVNNIDKTEYGFILKLMNARDPTMQGHLKVIQNKYGHVEALVFKKSTKEQEMIFHLPRVPKSLRLKEKAYFTDRWELKNENVDSLWGKSIYPFFKIHLDQNVQERLQGADSTIVTFVEKVIVVEKKQKKKKKKIDNIETGEEIEVEEEEEIAVVEEPEPEPVIKEEVKKENTRKAPQRRRFQGYSNTNSRDFEEEKEEVVEEVRVAEAASPPAVVANEEVAVSNSGKLSDEEIIAKAESEGKRVKIVREYFINLRSIITFEDGGVEDKSWTYPIKKVIEREDESAGPDGERYQMEFSLKKGDPIYLYLTGERTISSIEIGDKRYLMRGH